MYALWAGVSFLVAFTGRHLRLLSVHWFAAHAFLGSAILVMSLAFAGGVKPERKIQDNSTYQLVKGLHKTVGPAIFAAAVLLIVNGIFLRVQRKFFVLAAWVRYTRLLHVVPFRTQLIGCWLLNNPAVAAAVSHWTIPQAGAGFRRHQSQVPSPCNRDQ